MTLDKALVKKSKKINRQQMASRALNLLLEDMAVWFPVPYFDVKAMVYEETKNFKLSRNSKAH